MRSLPLPLALAARLAPVAVLATAGWALSSGPAATTPAAGRQAAAETSGQASPSAPSAPSTQAAPRTYESAPAPCAALAATTITSLVPGAKKAGREIPSTDTRERRTCSWNALQEYDYRWLDVSFEIMRSDRAAQASYEERVRDDDGGGAVPGLGDGAYSVVELVTEDGQETREGTVVARASNALVVVTYNGSDFETRKAPGTDEINKGAIRAAKEAVAALEETRRG